MMMMLGWWFGTWILLFHILGMSSSQLTNSIIFQRGIGLGQPPTRIILDSDVWIQICLLSGESFQSQLLQPGKKNRHRHRGITPLLGELLDHRYRRRGRTTWFGSGCPRNFCSLGAERCGFCNGAWHGAMHFKCFKDGRQVFPKIKEDADGSWRSLVLSSNPQ